MNNDSSQQNILLIYGRPDQGQIYNTIKLNLINRCMVRKSLEPFQPSATDKLGCPIQIYLYGVSNVKLYHIPMFLLYM